MLKKVEDDAISLTLVPGTQACSDEIFIVDDDPLISDLLRMAFEAEGYRVASFANGSAFSAAARGRIPACIILDVCLPGRSGLDLLKDIDAHTYAAPIIVMSGKASIPMAVEAIKNGAFDIIEKPFSPDLLVARVRDVTEAFGRRHAQSSLIGSLSAELPALTPREIEVLGEIVTGATNKQAGSRLKISPRTIEAHRSHIMLKLGARNTADLVRIALGKPPH